MQKEKVIAAAHIYKDAHNVSVAALVQYKNSGNLNDEEAYLRSVSMTSSLLAELIRIATPLMEGH